MAQITTVAARLPVEARSARRARDLVRLFRTGMESEAYLDLRLIVSELVVETLNGAPTERSGHFLKLQVALRGELVRVEVSDGARSYRLQSAEPEPGERGWGLHLALRLAERWGLRREQHSSTVWLELPRAPGRAGLGRRAAG